MCNAIPIWELSFCSEGLCSKLVEPYNRIQNLGCSNVPEYIDALSDRCAKSFRGDTFQGVNFQSCL